MHQIDLHGMTPEDALAEAAEVIARLAKNGQKGKLLIVHGYGSSGRGGVIKERLRKWLRSNGVAFLEGDLSGGNPGETTVLMDSAIEVRDRMIAPAKKVAGPARELSQDDLRAKILELCEHPQPLTKLTGKLRRFGDPIVRRAVEELVKERSLRIVDKGKHRCYCRI